MSILACGLNHKTAPLSIRERFAFVPEQLPESLTTLVNDQRCREITILSTCNRTEFYCDLDSSQTLLSWLCERHRWQQDDLIPYLYFHEEAAAVKHILRVATGLDSMVLGEPQIFGQMKTAFNAALEAGTVGPQLQRLFQYVFSTSKTVRTSTGIGTNPVSIAYAAVNLAKQVFQDLASKKVMVIGAGETIDLIMRYLQEIANDSDIVIVNRTYARAKELADKYHCKAMTFADMAAVLPSIDMVIAATNSVVPILGKGTMERVLKQRQSRPFLLLDLAVPRNIEPEVAELSGGISLYCIDDLQEIINKNLESRNHAAHEAEKLIELQVDHYMRHLNSLDVVQTVRAFRDKIETIRDEEIRNAMNLLHNGSSPEATLCILARNLTNKIMHIPTTQIRQAGYEQDLAKLAVARELFELD